MPAITSSRSACTSALACWLPSQDRLPNLAWSEEGNLTGHSSGRQMALPNFIDGRHEHMTIPSDILTLGRRLHNALRSSIEDPENYVSGRVAREDYEHYACGMYLAGTLAFLEGRYGETPWNVPSRNISLDSFLVERDDTRKERLQTEGVGVAGLDALVCIRNAIIHNDSDLARNRDPRSLAKVGAAALPGVSINGTAVHLSSTYEADFMEYVRKSFIAVSMLHGGL